jgi:hypothetical protein
LPVIETSLFLAQKLSGAVERSPLKDWPAQQTNRSLAAEVASC